MVPRSHSRAMVREVSMAAMMDMITATSPGTIMFRLSRVSLYQIRVSAPASGGSSRPCSRICEEWRATMAPA